MDQKTYELKRLEKQIEVHRHDASVKLALALIYCCTILGAIWIIMHGLKPIIGQEAESIRAFADLIRSFNLGTHMGYALALFTSSAWYFERKGKQRAIKLKSEYQHQLEKDEPNRGSSGLTPEGLSPKTRT